MDQRIVKIKGEVVWKCFRAKSGRHWIAVCDPLALTIQSETWANLSEDIAQALNALFSDLLKSRELEQFLSDRGWRAVGRLPAKPAGVWFDLPFVTTPVNRDTQVALR